MGALEAEVLEQIRAADEGLTPRDVLDRLGDGLAYTTVMTTMNRLWAKGQLEREKAGRSFRYRPLLSESEIAAARMAEALRVARDRPAALSRFVEELAPGDEELLRSLLDGEV
jgi:predicted transcriptional regulator